MIKFPINHKWKNPTLAEIVKRSFKTLKKDKFHRSLVRMQWDFKWQKHLAEWEKIFQKIEVIKRKHG